MRSDPIATRGGSKDSLVARKIVDLSGMETDRVITWRIEPAKQANVPAGGDYGRVEDSHHGVSEPARGERERTRPEVALGRPLPTHQRADRRTDRFTTGRCP